MSEMQAFIAVVVSGVGGQPDVNYRPAIDSFQELAIYLSDKTAKSPDWTSLDIQIVRRRD